MGGSNSFPSQSKSITSLCSQHICSLYGLLLEEKKYYIGKSSTPAGIAQRFKAHLEGNSMGAEWTKKYRPIEIIFELHNVDPLQEDLLTLQYMREYGIDNVRGGTYAQVILSETQLIEITTKLRGASDKCYKCGGDHFAARCKKEGYSKEGGDKKDNTDKKTESSKKEGNKKSNRGKKWTKEEESQLLGEITSGLNLKTIAQNHSRTKGAITARLKKMGICERCGHNNHTVEKCFAKTHICGSPLI